MSVQVLRLINGPLAVNTYFLHRDNSTETVVVDPGDGKAVLDFLAENGLNATVVLLTHGHFDHLCGVYDLKIRGAKVYAHTLDADCLENPIRSMAHFVRQKQTPCKVDFTLEDGDRFNAAGIDFEVIHTPGHTNGGVSYVIREDRILLSGDTLFKGVFGNVSFEEGDIVKMRDSIIKKLFTLDGDYRVLPGHNEETTLDEERKHNQINDYCGAY